MFKKDNDFSIKITICENMDKNKIIILTPPDLKEYIENILTIAQDNLEEDKNFGNYLEENE